MFDSAVTQRYMRVDCASIEEVSLLSLCSIATNTPDSLFESAQPVQDYIRGCTYRIIDHEESSVVSGGFCSPTILFWST